MSSFKEARDALHRTLLKVFPDATPVPRWAGVEAWGAPRPEAVVDHDAPGTYDPKVTIVGIADRKSGPVVYFLDPGDYFVLETEKTLLEGAGLKVGRGCIYHTRKGPLPTDALEALFRRVKERDARNAAAGAKAARATPAQAKKKAAAATGAKKAAAKRSPAPRDDGAAQVDAYLAELPDAKRAALERLRMQIRAAAPQATEKLGYGMPTFVHHGNLVHMAAFRDHCSFFPGSGAVTRAFENELEGFVTAKGTVRFTPEKPLPASLVKKIVKLRIAENESLATSRKAQKKPAARPRKASRAK